MEVDVYYQMTWLYIVEEWSRRWPAHVFRDVINMALINSWVIYKLVCQSNIRRRDYIQKLIEELAGNIPIVSKKRPAEEFSASKTLTPRLGSINGSGALLQDAEIALLTLAKAEGNPCVVAVHTKCKSCAWIPHARRTVYQLFYKHVFCLTKKQKSVESSLQKKMNTFMNKIFRISAIWKALRQLTRFVLVGIQKQSSWFCDNAQTILQLIADAIPGYSHVDQRIFLLKYVNLNDSRYEIQKVFSCLSIAATNQGKRLLNSMDTFEEHAIPLSDCKTQAYDNASNTFWISSLLISSPKRWELQYFRQVRLFSVWHVRNQVVW